MKHNQGKYYFMKIIQDSSFQHPLRISASVLDCSQQCSVLLQRPFGKDSFSLFLFIKSIVLLVCFL